MDYEGPIRFCVIGMGDAFSRYFYEGFSKIGKRGEAVITKVADVMTRDETMQRLRKTRASDVAAMIENGAVEYVQIVNDCIAPEGLLGDGVDAVYIATPNSTHKSYVRQALLAGKYVLCEKPIATDIADSSEMAFWARMSGRVCQDAAHYLYKYPCLMLYDREFAKSHGEEPLLDLAFDELGRIRSVEGSVVQHISEDVIDNGDGRMMYRPRLKHTVLSREKDGGITRDTMVHLVGMAYKLGNPTLELLRARMYNFDEKTFDAETACEAELRAWGDTFLPGAPVRFRAAKFSDSKDKAFHITFGEDKERGSIHIDFDSKSIEYSTSQSTVRRDGMGTNDFENLIARFIGCVNGRSSVLTPFSEAIPKTYLINSIHLACPSFGNPLEFYGRTGNGEFDVEV